MNRARIRRSARITTALLALAATSACLDATAPKLPPGSRAFSPPPVYEHWWSMTEACSGRSASLDAVRWYVVPGVSTIDIGGEEYSGYWFAADNRVVLAEGAQMAGALVRHEMLHALLDVGTHPRGEFLERCAGVVVCVDECITEAGPPPAVPPGTPVVTPDSLVLGLEVDPATPSGDTYGGYFTLTVTARNPANHAVVVLLPSSGPGEYTGPFSYRMEGAEEAPAYDDHSWDSEVTFFAAGESKRQVFDMSVGGPFGEGGVAPGTYRVEGAYGGRWTVPRSLVIAP